MSLCVGGWAATIFSFLYYRLSTSNLVWNSIPLCMFKWFMTCFHTLHILALFLYLLTGGRDYYCIQSHYRHWDRQTVALRIEVRVLRWEVGSFVLRVFKYIYCVHCL